MNKKWVIRQDQDREYKKLLRNLIPVVREIKQLKQLKQRLRRRAKNYGRKKKNK